MTSKSLLAQYERAKTALLMINEALNYHIEMCQKLHRKTVNLAIYMQVKYHHFHYKMLDEIKTVDSVVFEYNLNTKHFDYLLTIEAWGSHLAGDMDLVIEYRHPKTNKKKRFKILLSELEMFLAQHDNLVRREVYTMFKNTLRLIPAYADINRYGWTIPICHEG